MDIASMKVTELKAALSERGLDTKGNKAALVERLQEAEDNVDNNETRDTPVESNGNKCDDLYNPEELEDEEEGKSGENGNGSIGDNEASAHGDSENGAGFDNREFVHSKPQGISFGLHEPKPVKPQPKEAPVQSEADHDAAAEAASRARQGAASFFSSGPDPAPGGGAPGAEAAVPLPPTTSFMEDSEDEEEEGPPGLGNVELPIAVNKENPTDNKPKVPEVEEINWRDYEAAPEAVPEADWRSDRYLQSPAIFLAEEAEMAGEEVVYELEDNDVPGLSPSKRKMQLTYFETSMVATGDSEQEAMNNVALDMLKESGPWIDEAIWQDVTNGITAALPMTFHSWLPARYNLSHVSMLDAEGATLIGETPGRKLYRAEVLLGPLKCAAVTDNPKDAVAALGVHLKSFLSTRNLIALNESSQEELEGLTSKYHYVAGSGIVSVFMEGEGRTVVLPALDIFNLQKKLKDGKFPNNYGARDEYGCNKVFMCDLTNTRIGGVNAHEALKVHVDSQRHQRRLGRPGATPHLPKADQEEDPSEKEKYCIKMCEDSAEEGREVVATGYCVECERYMSDEYIQAHKKTKLTKDHTIVDVPAPIINHPRKDAAEGREVKKDSEGYLVRIYRCGTIMGKGDQGSRWGPPGGHPGMMGPGGMMAGPGGPMMGPGGWGGPMMGPGGWGGPMMAGPRHPGPGWGQPGGPQAAAGGPPDGSADAAPGGEGGEGEAPVKKGLVNDPMAGIGQGPPGGPPGAFQGGPGQWGPGPGWGGPQGGPGGWGGPPGHWGPRPPGPPMICVSQGVSGKICNHFRRGQCQYGNRCIHVHLMPNPAHQMAPPAQEEESDDEDGDEEGEGGETKPPKAPQPDKSGLVTGPGIGGPGMGAGPQGARQPLAPQQSMFEKREAAKSRAFEEAMAAAKAAAAKTGDLSSHLVTNRSAGENLSGGGINVMGPSVMHAYSVGQKSKKKDPKPEEQRPGDWQCECGNYNFAWRKECNACGKKKPFNQMEEETKQQELARIKAEREKRRQEGRGGGGGRLDPGDLRNRVGDRRDRDRDRDRDRGRGDRDRRSRDGGGDNPNMVPLGGGRGGRDDRSKDRDRDRGRDDRDRDRGRDDRGKGRDRDDRNRDRDRDRDRDDDRDKDRGRDRDDDRGKDRGRDRDKEKSKDKHKDKKDKSRDRDREDSYHKEKKEKKRKKSKDEYEDYEDDKDSKKHKRYYDDYEEESSSKKSKKSHDGYEDYVRESSAKKHKKSHKASKDNSDSDRDEKKKKKKKDKDKDKEERRRQRRSQEEEGEIPGDWGEWYDQANTNRRGAERY